MKKNAQERILGRKLAQQLTREELEKTFVGGAASTWTLTYPADGPYKDSPSTGPIFA